MKSERESLSLSFAGVNAPHDGVVNWEASDQQVRVTMAAPLARELGQTAIQGFLTIPKRGMEVGGLLFGRVRRHAGQPVFEITGTESVACEHRFGPSFVLDAPDRQQLAQLLARRNHDGSPAVVGFYRSFTSRDPVIDENDRDLLKTFFPDRPFVWLLLQPTAADACNGTFEIASVFGTVPEPAPLPLGYVPKPVVPEPDHEEEEIPSGEHRSSILVACILVAIVAITGISMWMQGRRATAAKVAPTTAVTIPAPPPALPPAQTTAPAPIAPPPIAPPPDVASTQPSVRRKFEPRISAGIRRRLTSAITVPVVVQVDARGRVTGASSNVTEHGLHRYLADEAVKAAYHCWFAPARSSNGQPVAGSTTISFEFTPVS